MLAFLCVKNIKTIDLGFFLSLFRTLKHIYIIRNTVNLFLFQVKFQFIYQSLSIKHYMMSKLKVLIQIFIKFYESIDSHFKSKFKFFFP